MRETIIRRIFILSVLCLCAGVFCACGAVTVEGPVLPGTLSADTTGASVPSLAPMTEPETETEPLPPEPEEYRASFVGVGDSIIHEGIWMEARKMAGLNGEGRAFDFSHLFDGMTDFISAADIAFINQETLMAGEEYGYSGYPRFNSPRDLAKDILDAGFDVVNIANNHMMDMLPEGLAATIDFWNEQPSMLIGGYKNAADYDDVRVIEANGIRVAFLSYCYGTNGLSMPKGYDMIIPYLDEAVIRRQTAIAHERADFVLVSVHWGEDSVQAVTQQQKTYAKLFADCGVDAVIGHHPHLIQPVEWIEGQGGHRMLCAYSLGNFYSLMPKSENMVGGYLCFDMVLRDGEASLENVRFVPTVFHYNMNFFGQHLYFMEEYTDKKAAAHGVANYGNTPATVKELEDYTRSLIAAEFLPEALRTEKNA